MKFPLGAMTVGDILDRGLKILFSRLPTFLIINVLFLSPTLAFQLANPPDEGADPGMTLVVLLGLVVLSIFASAAILHVIEREFAGRPVGVGSAIRVALSCFWSLLGATLLFILLVILATVVAIVPGMILIGVAGAVGPVAAIPVVIGFVVGLLALVAWVFVRFYFFSQVVVMERRDAASSLVRSKDLSRGHGWRIFGVFVLIFLVYIGAGLLALALNLALGTEFVPVYVEGRLAGFQVIPANYSLYVVHTVVTFLLNIVVSSYLAVCLTLLYFDLRIRKEGFDLELAAQQDIPEVLPVSPVDVPPTAEEMPGTDRPW